MILHLLAHSAEAMDALRPGQRKAKIQVIIGAMIPNSFSTVRFLMDPLLYDAAALGATVLRRVSLAGGYGGLDVLAREVQQSRASAQHRLGPVLVDHHAAVALGFGNKLQHVQLG